MSKNTKICLISLYFGILTVFIFMVFNMASASAAQSHFSKPNSNNYYVSCINQLYASHNQLRQEYYNY